jgi:hypothetical protein
MINLKGSRRKRSWPNLGYFGFAWRYWGKPPKNLREDSQNLKPGPHEYEAVSLSTRPRRSVLGLTSRLLFVIHKTCFIITLLWYLIHFFRWLIGKYSNVQMFSVWRCSQSCADVLEIASVASSAQKQAIHTNIAHTSPQTSSHGLDYFHANRLVLEVAKSAVTTGDYSHARP